MAERFKTADELEIMRRRFVDENPPLTDEEIKEVRQNTSTHNWMELQKEKLAKNVTPISAGRSDQQIAEEIRDDLRARLEVIGEIVTKARRDHGMTVAFQFTGPDTFGRTQLVMLEIAKKLC